MNKIERSIYDVKHKIKGLNETMKGISSEINACNACLQILEKIRDDKFIPNEEKMLYSNSPYSNGKQL